MTANGVTEVLVAPRPSLPVTRRTVTTTSNRVLDLVTPPTRVTGQARAHSLRAMRELQATTSKLSGASMPVITRLRL
ncbi:hypothetical protein B0H10DRAFT_1979710 [Mycena sp. CBHHK59/15]|nr:hypothetical protein B0H10DRAFT_1979710 [Mycena sp. CBHHK59/15]